ncbi:MAG: sulfatase-like hydrolase/transferase [Verrucomicrobiia bacterium]|jgi:arylsulfatase
MFCVVLALQAAQKPNIVLIMGEDMGYSDIGCYGSEINTPHLDRLCPITVSDSRSSTTPLAVVLPGQRC